MAFKTRPRYENGYMQIAEATAPLVPRRRLERLFPKVVEFAEKEFAKGRTDTDQLARDCVNEMQSILVTIAIGIAIDLITAWLVRLIMEYF